MADDVVLYLCPHCGAFINEDADICPSCKKELKEGGSPDEFDALCNAYAYDDTRYMKVPDLEDDELELSEDDEIDELELELLILELLLLELTDD